MAGEDEAKFFEGAGDAFFGGVFGGVEGEGDFGEGFFLEDAEEDGVAVFGGEAGEGGVEVGGEVVEGGFGGSGDGGPHGGGLLFVAGTAGLALEGVGGGEAGGDEEPTGEDDAGGEGGGFWARTMKTAWVTSSARAGSRTWRRAAE